MHELSIAVALVEEVRRAQQAERAPGVVAIKLRMGRLSGVDRAALEGVFPLVAEGTGLEHARLDIEEVPAEATCDACGAVSTPERLFMHCGKCGSTRVRITGGRDFSLVAVELQLESDDRPR